MINGTALVLALFAPACRTAAPPPPAPREELGLTLMRQPEAPAKQKSLRGGTKSFTGKRGREVLAHVMDPEITELSLEGYEALVLRITQQVSDARGLRLQRPIHVQLLTDEPFEDALQRLDSAFGRPDEEKQLASMIFAFGIGVIDRPPEAVPPKKGHKAESVVGLYDPDTHTLLIRRSDKPLTLSRDELIRTTIAHEAEHAAQRENLPFVDLKKISNRDQLLAVRSVYEGDGELARTLAGSEEDPRKALVDYAVSVAVDAKVRDRIRTVDAQSFIANEAAWANAWASFPYRQGTIFLTRLYLSGGFALVNDAFKHLPVSTEQVLHPEKYMEGESPVDVPRPVLPEGNTLLSEGTQGELGIRSLLAQCLVASRASAAAAGWGGDSYLVSQDASGHVSLTWNTAWDSELDATEFADALTADKDCWGSARTTKYQWSIDGHYAVRQQGRVVSVVRGFPKAAEKQQLRALLRFKPVTPTRVPPFRSLPLASDEVGGRAQALYPEDREPGGTLKKRHFEHKALGISADFPLGFASRVDTDSGSMQVETLGEKPAFGAMRFTRTNGIDPEELMRGGASAWTNEVFGNVAEALDTYGMGETPKIIENAGVMLPLGHARFRRWDTQDEDHVQVEVVLVPVCNGEAAFVFVLGWTKPSDRMVVEQWTRTVRPLNGMPLQVCNNF